MTVQVKTPLQQTICDRQQLVDFLAGAGRPRDRWGVGVEVEKLVVDRRTGEAADFQRIEDLLKRLERSGKWSAVREENHLVALLGASSSITLEPGGQLELSGKLCPDLFCCQRDYRRHVARIVSSADSLDLAFLGLGVQPFTPLKDIDWLPRQRYRIMQAYMMRTGDMGQHMMKKSAGVQVNLDFCDEADCMDKMRTAQHLAPLCYALFANSPLMEGRPTGFLSTRGEIWRRTDPDRAGLIPALFREDASFDGYVDYALGVPMYFILRDGRLLDVTGQGLSFGRFLAEGFQGYRPTLADWDLHLSTLFPEVRLRPQIELRSADSLPPELAMSVAALLKGLLYDDEARRQVQIMFGRLDADERQRLYHRSWRQGLRTPCDGRTLREVARDIIVLAREGLCRQGRARCTGRFETEFLDALAEVAESGVTLAERLLQNWRGNREERLAALLEHCGYEFR
jgi:glutamate--cysteine ligase